MQSRAGVTAESLVELKEALKLVMNESAAGEPYAAEEVQVSDRPRGQQSLVLGDNKLGSGHVQRVQGFIEILFRGVNTIVGSVLDFVHVCWCMDTFPPICCRGW